MALQVTAGVFAGLQFLESFVEEEEAIFGVDSGDDDIRDAL